MRYFHASKSKVFTHRRTFKTRYGFSVSFFTGNPDLVKLYFDLYKGQVISINFDSPDYEIDYKSKSSYSVDFRNLIFRLKKENYKSVLIKNVLDYPTQKTKRIIISDILIIFDSSIIANYDTVNLNCPIF